MAVSLGCFAGLSRNVLHRYLALADRFPPLRVNRAWISIYCKGREARISM